MLAVPVPQAAVQPACRPGHALVGLAAGAVFTCFLMGIVAVPAGIGGGTLFVPIVGSFFPFHLDFVRGAGLLVALASALSAGPTCCCAAGWPACAWRCRWRVLASASSIGGALLGLAMPAHVVQGLLGGLVLGIVLLMLCPAQVRVAAGGASPTRCRRRWRCTASSVDRATGRRCAWQVHRTPLGLLLFLAIGVLAGMFGIGAGWANVPVLNLLMGAPLKVSAGTSASCCRWWIRRPPGSTSTRAPCCRCGGAVGRGHDGRGPHRGPPAERAEGRRWCAGS
jgi:uncharacterized membrane protein YfcA